MDRRSQRAAEFLRDYWEVCRRHGIIVDGCGHCYSPYLSYESKGDAGDLGEHVLHLMRGVLGDSEEEPPTLVELIGRRS